MRGSFLPRGEGLAMRETDAPRCPSRTAVPNSPPSLPIPLPAGESGKSGNRRDFGDCLRRHEVKVAARVGLQDMAKVEAAITG